MFPFWLLTPGSLVPIPASFTKNAHMLNNNTMDQLHHFSIVVILTFGFAFASVLGYLTYRAKLSPILGYLLAGYFIGPYSPGFVADINLAEDLAEIGVVLMMFGVGLHFRWQDLVKTSRIAIPGAILQTLVAATLGTALIYSIGWTLQAGIVFGLAIGVASTVVLVHVLSGNGLISTPQGHLAVGWLIVEDMITVVALLLIPTLAASMGNGTLDASDVMGSFGLILFKFVLLIGVLFTIGLKCVSYILSRVTETQSHELFTLTILAITFVIAAGSAVVFGTSIALGSFIAGMVVGQTHVRKQVARHSTPLRDAFIVIFFLSVGMLFNPAAIVEDFWLFAGTLAIILIAKPLVALLITLVFKYPFRTALAVALALAQIGEFSFILAEEAMKFKILPDKGYDILVACALVSISINPLIFKLAKT